MKTPSKDLFELIKKMTPNEKRQYVVHTKVYKKSENNIKLFRYLIKQKVYDEEILLAFFKKESFIKNFAVAKSYLYHSVLDFLSQQYSDKSPSQKLRNHLKQIEVLFTKSLYQQAAKILTKAISIAKENELYLELIECYHWQFKMRHVNHKMEKEEDLDLRNKELSSLHLYENNLEYRYLAARFFATFDRVGAIRNEEDKVFFKNIIDNPLLQNENSAKTIKAKYNYFSIYSIYYALTHDFDNTYLVRKKLIKVFEEHPSFIAQHPMVYLKTYNNFIVSALRQKKYKEVLKSVEYLKNLTDNDPLFQDKVFQATVLLWSHLYKITISSEQGDMVLLKQQVDEAALNIEYLQDYLHTFELIPFYKWISNSYFYLGNYPQALESIQRIILNPSLLRMDEQGHSHLLFLMIHFEMDNRDIFDYVIKITYRWFLKKEQLYDFERLILSFLKRIPKIQERWELLEEFKHLRDGLIKLKSNPHEYAAFQDFDYITWLNSKIKRKPMAQLMRDA